MNGTSPSTVHLFASISKMVIKWSQSIFQTAGGELFAILKSFTGSQLEFFKKIKQNKGKHYFAKVLFVMCMCGCRFKDIYWVITGIFNYK